MQESPTITIITASHRNLAGLQLLHAAIKQLDRGDLEWIIKDSGACLKTAMWAAAPEQLGRMVRFINNKDSGIYDALNIAIQAARGRYYVVVGSDDHIFADSLNIFLKELKSGKFERYELIALPVVIGGNVRRRKKWLPTWISAGGLAASHSVGLAISAKLHDRMGFYDTNYKILADSLFLVQAHQAGVRTIDYNGPPIGEFNINGISSTEHGPRILEGYLYNCDCGHSRYVQAILAAARLIKYLPAYRQSRFDS